MSYPIHVYNICEKCNHEFETVVETRINGAIMHDTQKIGTNTLNMIECPSCGHKTRATIAVLYDDVFEKSAIWYLPCGNTDDFYTKARNFYANYRDGLYAKNINIETTKTWEEFQEKTSKIIMRASMAMATRHNGNIVAEAEGKQIAGQAYEFDVETTMDKELRFSSKEPLFVLQNGSCFYIGEQKTKPTSSTNVQHDNHETGLSDKSKSVKNDSYNNQSDNSTPSEVKIFLIIMMIVFLFVLLSVL